MARKKKAEITEALPPAPAKDQPITETIEKNYMPYVMSVIVSRAIPEIDGFKPSHRKLLYTMYKMGLLSGPRTKSANVVGQTMRLNPHGDAAIYDTMVRLTSDYAALLHPFVDSKGSFGKQYSSSMATAASRYTEVRLDKFASELFVGIDKDAVEMIDNYDNTMKEPALLPTTFPNILVTPNMGIAVGMASRIAPFNLSEVCDATIALLKSPKLTVDELLDIMPAPDFPGGGEIIYDRDTMRRVYETGEGPVKIRAKYRYDKAANCIDILEIPYSTTIEIIMKKIAEMMKSNQLRDVVDFRDEIDLSGFKLTLDLRRGAEPDKVMLKLFKSTALEDNFSCNFNVIINSSPVQLGVLPLLKEWINFRKGCLTRELTFELNKKKDKLHLLLGLGKILLDIDKAIKIIRNTQKESEVISNLCKGFSIDERQAEYIAEIKLRYLNREYLINRINEIDSLQGEIADLEETLADEIKMKRLIAKQLAEIKKKYGQPRRSTIINAESIDVYRPEEHIENFTAHFFLTAEGYFKKITDKSLRGNDEQRLKDGDRLIAEFDGENISEFAVFTNKAQLYRFKASDFGVCKASEMGEFLPAKLKFDDGEKPIFIRDDKDWDDKRNMVFVFENGKGVKVPLSAYAVKGTRRKMTGAFSTVSPIVGIFEEHKNAFELLIISSADRAIVISTSLFPLKTTRTAAGSQLILLKKGATVREVLAHFDDRIESTKGYKKTKIPATPVLLAEKDIDKMQIGIDI
ncbi:MAG: DNA gyrase subunit A [Eubacteriales bacterium]